MPGGFSSDYDSVAVETYSKDMQNRCVFGFDRAAKFGKECTTFAAKLNSKVNEFLEDVFPDKVLHNTGVHVLFNWNAHSLFSYHRDAGSDITCIINLSPAKSTFHVAGFEPEATYTEPGSMFLLPSDVFHRSGFAALRTIKVAYFFKMDKKLKEEEKTTDAVATEAGSEAAPDEAAP